MKIFLTGGNGFIGRNIIEQLGGTHTILAPTRAELDLTDTAAVYDYLKANPVDVVINAANIGGTRKQQHVFGTTHTNLKIFFNIIRAKPFFSRLITLGSGAEYGKDHSLAQIKESQFGERVPSDEYGIYKYTCAQFAEHVDYITHLRLFAVFGKYEDYEIRFISNAICKALVGLPITMRQNVRFDYLFVDDFIHILDACIRQKPEETFLNIGRGDGIDLKTIAEKIVHELGSDTQILIANQGWGREYTCDTSRLQKFLPNFTYMPFDLAIAKLIGYYQTIMPNLKRESLVNDI